jgi:hypothetical protein
MDLLIDSSEKFEGIFSILIPDLERQELVLGDVKRLGKAPVSTGCPYGAP